LSADGRFVTFMSGAENLVPEDDDGAFENDVFVHDRKTGDTELVSVNSGDTRRDGDSGADQSPISADGRYVAFWSEATNLVPHDENNYVDVFVRDRVRGTTTRVSVSSSGEEVEPCGPECDPFTLNDATPKGGTDRGISITPNGRFVAFEYVVGLDERYPPGPPAEGGFWGIYVHDSKTHTTELVSVNNRGESAGGTPYGSDFPVISADGRYVAFRSGATNLVCRGGTCSGWDTNGTFDVFVHDRRARKTQRVSVDSYGNEQVGVSLLPSISADGRYVAFASSASNLGPATEHAADFDVFVHDRKTGDTELVSVNSAGDKQDEGGATSFENGGHDQLQPAISADGRYVAFTSPATNLAANDDNEQFRDIFLHDRLHGITTLVSVSSAGRSGDGPSGFPALSADARFVAFTSTSEFVEEDEPALHNDVFVHSLPFL
jgi:Tol biopolymer transport system component